MKVNLPGCIRLLFALILVCCGTTTYASHIFGVDLFYTYVSGTTYQVTLVVYGDCAGVPTFNDLSTSTPSILIDTNNVTVQTITLAIQQPNNGVLVSPVCPNDSNNTTCASTSNTIPGIKKFVYTGTTNIITTPHTHWRFVFQGAMGNSSAGRAVSITNINNPSNSIIYLVDTLNNTNGPNSSPTLTSLPTPFFCDNLPANYNPGAVAPNPADSLAFFLVPGQNAGTPVVYIGGVTATEPIVVGAPPASNFSFASNTGQLEFTPDQLQKSLVVYNVEQYLNGVLVGTCQREMTFVVLNCNNEPPTGGIDSASTGTVVDSAHFTICESEGPFTFHIDPTDPADSPITVTAAGLPPGATFNVTNPATAHPLGLFSWTTAGEPEGTYTFFLTMVDNNCPLTSKQIYAYSITLVPRPSVTIAILSQPTCFREGQFTVTPSGQGSPWVITVLQNNTVLQTINNVTGTTLDSLGPGTYIIRTSTAASNLCDSETSVTFVVPQIPTPTLTFVSPTTCIPNGSLTVHGLSADSTETINYNLNGTPQPPVTAVVAGNGTITIGSMGAGTYDNVTATLGNCISNPAGPVTLAPPPPITIAQNTSVNPDACGFCNGSITLYGLPPNNVDTVTYTFNGMAQPPVTVVSGSNSTVAMINLCQGSYDNIVVHVQGGCFSAPVGPITLTAPTLTANYAYNIHYGCNGDTVVFTNASQYAGTVYYQWKFSDDGLTDTATNPTHIFLTQGVYTVKLFITNLHCVDSTMQTISLVHPIQPGFTLSSDTICQGQTIVFTNTSVGTQPVYFWDFGDGFGSITGNPSHTFNIAGVYQVKLAENDFVPCFDTAVTTVFVDSTSAINFSVSDSQLCEGKQIVFTGDYSTIGNIGNIWSFGDGSIMTNSNPAYHAYNTPGVMQVTLTTDYRICRDTSITKTVTIYPFPVLDLGPDTAVCPNSTPIALHDLINAANPLAKWLWSTGDTSSTILIDKPDTYYTTVTIDGCSTSDSVWVRNDCYVNIPNAFTPNGDGFNDYFFPRQVLSSSLTAFSMNIYNRWGELIFTTTNTEGRGWDGKFNDELQPQGVYIYVIDATFRDGEKEHYQGNVTLFR